MWSVLNPLAMIHDDPTPRARRATRRGATDATHSGAIYNTHPRPRRDGGREALVTDDGRRRFVHEVDLSDSQHQIHSFAHASDGQGW